MWESLLYLLLDAFTRSLLMYEKLIICNFPIYRELREQVLPELKELVKQQVTFF